MKKIDLSYINTSLIPIIGNKCISFKKTEEQNLIVSIEKSPVIKSNCHQKHRQSFNNNKDDNKFKEIFDEEVKKLI